MEPSFHPIVHLQGLAQQSLKHIFLLLQMGIHYPIHIINIRIKVKMK